MTENFISGLVNIMTDNIKSKVIGRRNWVIKTYQNFATLWGFGEARRNGVYCSVLVNDIGEFNIH